MIRRHAHLVVLTLVLAIVLAAATAGAQRIPRVGYLGLGKEGPSLVGEAFRIIRPSEFPRELSDEPA